jgi:hypothetical protein
MVRRGPAKSPSQCPSYYRANKKAARLSGFF